MKKIILIRSHYLDARIEREAESLVNNGFEVTFLAWNRHQLVNNSDRKYKVQTFNLSVPPSSIKVAFYLPIWWLYIIYKLLSVSWDVVHAADFDTYVPALLIAKVKKKYIIYDIFDFYADMIQFPIFPRFFAIIFSKVDRYLMKFADGLIIADDSRIKQIGQNANKNVITLNNCPKEYPFCHHFLDTSKSSLFTIFFGGIVLEERGIIDIISATKDFKDINLVIMGYCGYQDFEKKLYKFCENLSNVTLHLHPVPHSEIILNTMKADLLFTIYDTTIRNNVFSSPNKLFESMMFSKPIIVSEGTSMAEIAKAENCGLIVPYGDIEEIQKAVIRLKDDELLRKKLGENGRKAFETKYNWNIMEKRLLDLYSGLN